MPTRPLPSKLGHAMQALLILRKGWKRETRRYINFSGTLLGRNCSLSPSPISCSKTHWSTWSILPFNLKSVWNRWMPLIFHLNPFLLHFLLASCKPSKTSRRHKKSCKHGGTSPTGCIRHEDSDRTSASISDATPAYEADFICTPVRSLRILLP